MAAEISIAPVLEQYPGLGPIRRIHALANAGGFSGSLLWRIEKEAGDLCLRRWPREHPSDERLMFIHGVLQQLGQSGLNCIPVPIRSQKGKTFIVHDEHFWELAPWMPGKADFHENPDPQRLKNVMEVVAQLHRVAQAANPRCHALSPTLLSRRDQLQRLVACDADQLAAAVEHHASQPLQNRGRRLLAQFRSRAPATAAKIDEATKIKGIPLFPVIRDLWHDHILFTDDEVTGIVDFGALRVDSAACDLSRLLGSLIGNDKGKNRFALDAYQAVRHFSWEERFLAEALDEANVILAGLNWLQWICVEGRTFPSTSAVLARLDEILLRLEGQLPA